MEENLSLSKNFKIELSSPDTQETYDHCLNAKIISSSQGEVEILPNHSDMIMKIDNGTIRIDASNPNKRFVVDISEGILNLVNNVCSITAKNITVKSV